jgi:AraC family L-rhamnose operon transcriptional activator RhaR
MHHFRSLFIDRGNVRMSGLRILTFALHRHLSERSSIGFHSHRWSQVLLYLSGRGKQIFKHAAAEVDPGTLVVVPPRMLHAFESTSVRPPHCLMINFHLHGERARPEVVCLVNHFELAQIRQHLADLLRLQAKARGLLHWESAMVILQILITMLRTAGWIEREQPLTRSDSGPAVRRLLTNMNPSDSLMNVVQRSGYNRDHLNRLVKKETGLTLGQLRTSRRLAKAKELLSTGMQVGDVAAEIGLPDQSYFARWFRRQTDRSPSRWSQLAKRGS